LPQQYQQQHPFLEVDDGTMYRVNSDSAGSDNGGTALTNFFNNATFLHVSWEADPF